MAKCEICNGSGHVYNKRVKRWKRCSCFYLVRVENMFPEIDINKVKEFSIAGARIEERSCLFPSSSYLDVSGNVLSVSKYFINRGIDIKIVLSSRLLSISFETDEEFSGFQDFLDSKYLLFVLGIGERANKQLGSWISSILEERAFKGLVTHVFISTSSIGALLRKYQSITEVPSELTDILSSFYEVLG